MGFLDKILSKEPEYPALDQSSAASQRIEKQRKAIEPFFKRVNEKFEMVPADDTIYVFVGKPPSAFGVAWFDGKEHNLKSFMQDHGLTPQKVQLLSDELRDVYIKFKSEERYSTTIAGKKITVTPSDDFAKGVAHVIKEAASS